MARLVAVGEARPAVERTYSGAERGLGAVYAYTGNSKVGAGRMKITEATAPSRIAIQLDFIKPMAAHNVCTFMLAPQGGATEVAWTMSGTSPYMAKVMTTFMSMEKLVGRQFEEGLANLKALAERSA
jgi:hypothetical protein